MLLYIIFFILLYVVFLLLCVCVRVFLLVLFFVCFVGRFRWSFLLSGFGVWIWGLGFWVFITMMVDAILH